MGDMENIEYAGELNSPPPYSAMDRKTLKEEVKFLNSAGQQIQTTVVTVMPEELPVRDHIIWSLVNTIYMNICCLGLIALVFSVKSRDRKLQGDKQGAASYGSTARSLNIAATTLTILISVILIIIYIANVVLLVELLQDGKRGYGK